MISVPAVTNLRGSSPFAALLAIVNGLVKLVQHEHHVSIYTDVGMMSNTDSEIYTYALKIGRTGIVETDINSGYKYPDLPGTLNYRKTGGSNQVEVQIRV